MEASAGARLKTIYFILRLLAAFLMSPATACGCETWTAWLPLASATPEPDKF
jgi:hypothetical protein